MYVVVSAVFMKLSWVAFEERFDPLFFFSFRSCGWVVLCMRCGDVHRMGLDVASLHLADVNEEELLERAEKKQNQKHRTQQR